MREKLIRLNRYSYEVDPIDKYREAIRRSNRTAMYTLSISAILVAVAVFVYNLLAWQTTAGVGFCVVLLGTGIGGLILTRRENVSRTVLSLIAWALSAAFFLLAIHGTIRFRTESFWIGMQLAVACYLLDYPWKIGLAQLLSFLLLRIVCVGNHVTLTSAGMLATRLFFAVGLVTSYVLNRTRLSLIMGREESQRQADTDLLTGLTMRIAAQQEIEEHLKSDEHGVMMLLDLDRFKSVNDKLGHQMGDKVLVDVAADLKKMFRNSDVLSRLGGDEFVVYMKSVPEKEWALQRAEDVVREVRRWVGNGTTNIQISASVGIVMTDMVERTYDSLYRAADVAMYHAKAAGGNKALFFAPEMLEHSEEEENARHLTAENIQSVNDLR